MKNIAWTDVQELNSISQPIHWFNGSNYDASTIFEYYKGYYYYNAENLSSLTIPYVSSDTLAKFAMNKTGSAERELTLTLYVKGEKINQVAAGYNSDAKAGFDRYDKFAPPGDFVKNRMVIKNESLETSYKWLYKDYRGEIGDMQIYDVVIKQEPGKLLTLQTEGVEDFEEYNIYLVDKRLNNVYDLNRRSDFQSDPSIHQGRINFQSVHVTNEFKLVIGKSEFTDEYISEFTPKEYVLYQNYPNPFNNGTIIRFSIPEEDRVTLEIYSILGERILTLIENEYYEPGYYEKYADFNNLSSGVYLYRMLTSDYSSIRKMLYIK
jgi:hypothetical protein